MLFRNGRTSTPIYGSTMLSMPLLLQGALTHWLSSFIQQKHSIWFSNTAHPMKTSDPFLTTTVDTVNLCGHHPSQHDRLLSLSNKDLQELMDYPIHHRYLDLRFSTHRPTWTYLYLLSQSEGLQSYHVFGIHLENCLFNPSLRIHPLTTRLFHKQKRRKMSQKIKCNTKAGHTRLIFRHFNNNNRVGFHYRHLDTPFDLSSHWIAPPIYFQVCSRQP
ncbi:MAG: hypothetical protein J3R72DRAFT_431492 [Linnemannia gamsii]|nr:MAG: hypothetical protein J3R72DRAFT_431492 [Linnemannia gamsii]